MGDTDYKTPRDLRVAIAKAFLADKDRFFDALPKKYRTRNGPATYAEEIKAGNVWSDNIELVIMQELLKRPIHIYSYERKTVTRIGGADGEPMTIAFPNEAVVHEGGEDTRPIMLGYRERLHYEGLEEHGRRRLIKPSTTATANTTTTEQSTNAAAGAASARRSTRSTRGSTARTSTATSAASSTTRRRKKTEKEDDRLKPSKKNKPSNATESSSAMEVDDDDDGQFFMDAEVEETFEDTVEEASSSDVPWYPSDDPIADPVHVEEGSKLLAVWEDGKMYPAEVTATVPGGNCVMIEYDEDGVTSAKDLGKDQDPFVVLCDDCSGEDERAPAVKAYRDLTGKERPLCLCADCDAAHFGDAADFSHLKGE